MQRFKETNDHRDQSMSRLPSWPGVILVVLLLTVACWTLTVQQAQAQRTTSDPAQASQPQTTTQGTVYLPLVANMANNASVVDAAGPTLILNTASVSADQYDTDTTDNGAANCLVAGAGTVILNMAGVSSDESSTGSNGTTAANCLALAAPDLVIGKSGPATATQGTNFAYTLSVTNTGTVATSGVVTVTDSLPAGLSFVSGSGGGFSCSASGQTVTCTSSTAIAASGTATINLMVNPTTTGTVSNTASVVGGGDTTPATSNTANTTVNAAPTATPTATSVPPTATPTATSVPPTATPTSTPVVNTGIEYKIVYNTTTNRYEVWMRPNTTPGSPNQTSTAQVTIKAPHLTSSAIFSPTNLTPLAGTSWALNSRVNAPSEATGNDYLSFDLSFPANNTGAFGWTANQEVLAFSFQNPNGCVSPVSLMDNSDPFNVQPNSANTNPGNQIDVFGLGADPGNDYIGIYGAAAVVCPAPDLVTALGQPTPALIAGVQSNLPVTVTNQGLGVANGPITTTVTLPAGVSAPATFAVNGWSCTTSGQTVTCTNPGPLGAGASSPFYVPITASAPGGPLTFNATTAPTSGETNTGNNAATPVSATVTAFADGCFAMTAPLTGAQQVPAVNTTATGSGQVLINTTANTLVYTVTLSNLTGETMAHIHGFAAPGVNAGILTTLPMGSLKTGTYTFAEADQASILQGLTYFNVHTVTYGNGEIRGQIGALAPVSCTAPAKTLPIKVFLAGPYNTTTGLMSDALRSQNLLPTTEPYSGLGYSFVGGGQETVNASVFSVTGNDAIVDWVVVELRGTGALSNTVVASRAALLQRDGDVVGLDGISPLSYTTLSGSSYQVAVRHRNHSGAMTLNPVTLSTSTATVDFTVATTALYGANAERVMSNSKLALWAGNANGNTAIIATGPGNDVNAVLTIVLSDPNNASMNTNYIFSGYQRTDVNMDGKTIGAGPNNDVNPVLVTVLSHPANAALARNYIVQEQLPR